jgi:hypothetical protein
MLRKRGLCVTAVSVGALAAALVASSPAGAGGVKAAGPGCTARNGSTCVLIAGSGGVITFVAHDHGGSTWTIRDDSEGNTVLQTGDSSASGGLTTGWAANDEIELSISGQGSIKATWGPGLRR